MDGGCDQKRQDSRLGLSQADGEEIRQADTVTPLAAVQNEYSMMERTYEKDAIPVCGELGIGFVPFSPLASGFLSGKYGKESKYEGDDVRRVITRYAPENVAANQPLLDLLHKFAELKKATPAQISLAWMLKKAPYIVPIPGMRSEERIRENLGECQLSNDKRFFPVPFTWNLANRAIVRSTISSVFETTMDFLLNLAYQCR